MSTSKHDAAVRRLARVLPWTSSIELANLSRRFQQIQSANEVEVWLTVTRGNPGFDTKTGKADWANDETLAWHWCLPMSKPGAPVVALYHRPFSKSRTLRQMADAVSKHKESTDASVPSRTIQAAFEIAKTAGKICGKVDLPWLDVGATEELTDEIRWVCALHHLLREGLLHGAEDEMRDVRMPPKDPEESARFLTVGGPHERLPIDMRLLGFVWKIPDFIQMSVNATALLARIAEQPDFQTDLHPLGVFEKRLSELADKIEAFADSKWEVKKFIKASGLLGGNGDLTKENSGESETVALSLSKVCVDHLDARVAAQRIRAMLPKRVPESLTNGVRSVYQQTELNEAIAEMTSVDESVAGEFVDPESNKQDAGVYCNQKSTPSSVRDMARRMDIHENDEKTQAEKIAALPARHRHALLAFSQAENALATPTNKVTIAMAWEWVEEHYEGKKFTNEKAFSDYVTQARGKIDANVNQRRSGRTGRSIASPSEI